MLQGIDSSSRKIGINLQVLARIKKWQTGNNLLNLFVGWQSFRPPCRCCVSQP
jgi:hypothetical protein